MSEAPELEARVGEKYKYGFVTEIESEKAAKGLSEETVRFISAKKGEPEWLLEWRLKAFRRWQQMEEPTWAKVHYPKIDFQDAYYYAAPKQKKKLESLDEVDPELLETYKKLGIPLQEQDPQDLIWIRDEFMLSSHDFGKMVIFGHTPLQRVFIAPDKIGIDTGAVYGGTLTCLELPAQRFYSV